MQYIGYTGSFTAVMRRFMLATVNRLSADEDKRPASNQQPRRKPIDRIFYDLSLTA